MAAGPGPSFIWDSEVAGFGLKVTKNGRRTYVLQYRLGRRTRRFSIGVHGSPWTVEAARGRAKVLLGEVVADRDPQDDRRAARAAWTVSELFEEYLTVGLATRKQSSIDSARSDFKNHIEPRMGSSLARDVTAADVDRLVLDIAAGVTARKTKTAKKKGLSRVRGGKGAANAALTTLRAGFTFGIRRGVRLDNPTLGVRKFPEKKLNRFLSPAELARLGEVLKAAEALGVESPYALAAIRLLLLSGCRRNEILSLKRSYVDAHNRCLRLPDSKTGAKIVHVGDAVLQIIAQLPPVPGNDHVLPGEGGDGHLVNLQKVWVRIRGAAGLGDVRIHDLRHAFASVGAVGGDSLLIIGALLGHKSTQTTERYTHLAAHPMKDAADRISAEIARMMGINTLGLSTTRMARADAAPPPPGVQTIFGAVIETRWLDTATAAAFLGRSTATLATYRWDGTGPTFRKVGRRIVYAMGDLEAWRAAHGPPRTPTPSPGGPNVVQFSDLRRAASR